MRDGFTFHIVFVSASQKENGRMIKGFFTMSIEINGKQYKSISEAADDLNVTSYAVRSALKKGITTIKKREKRERRPGKPVTINGKSYCSYSAAADDLNYNIEWIRRCVKRGITSIEPQESKRYGKIGNGKGIEVTDCEGNVYKSMYAMDIACGFAYGTTHSRVASGRKLEKTKLPTSKKNGVIRYDVYYNGILYHGFDNAVKLLQHSEQWVKKNCHLIPVYQDRWERTDIESGLWYDIKNIMYRPMQWNEDRIIEEVDRRMKKLFAHGKLIKHKEDAQ